MPDLVLSVRQQDSLRRLMSLEATPGRLPPGEVLQLVDELVGSDVAEVTLSDRTGWVLDQVALEPSPWAGEFQACDGPLLLGLVHQGRTAGGRAWLAESGIADGVTLGFRCGPDHVVQLSLDRFSGAFSPSDLAMLRMIGPVLQRLLRTTRTPGLPGSLTLTERRVLQLVSTGRSNAEIAQDLCVSVATVRKHLEHTYRKLGVHSRMAAVVAFEGGPRAELPRDELVEKYA